MVLFISYDKIKYDMGLNWILAEISPGKYKPIPTHLYRIEKLKV